MSQVAHALAEAHGQGLIHRDVKPANVVLCNRDGAADMAKVVDFGLVKDLQSPRPDLSTSGMITGTPLYMAPETISSPGDVDGRVDIYALGAVGYFLLTGVTVFEGQSTVEVCGHHLHTPPLPPSARGCAVENDLESVVLRCLEKRPDDRYQDTMQLRRALQQCDAAAEWSLEDAAAWWAEHEQQVREVRDASRRPITDDSKARLAVTVAAGCRRSPRHGPRPTGRMPRR